MTNIAKMQKELAAARLRETTIAAKIRATQATQLTALPTTVGLSSVDELIKALVPYASPRMKARYSSFSSVNKTLEDGVPAQKAPKTRKQKRTKITNAIRTTVKKLVRAGKTGAEVAKTIGISLPSVHNIKKALGLVTARK